MGGRELLSVLHVNEKGGNFGGTEEYIELVSRAWRRRGVRCELLCGRLVGQPAELDAIHVVEPLARRDQPGAGVGELVAVVAATSPDLVYVHNVFDPAVMSALARAPGAPLVVWYVHDHYVTCLSELRLRTSGSCGRVLGEACLTGIDDGECLLRHRERTFGSRDLEERRRLAAALGEVDVVVVVSEYMARTLQAAHPGLTVQRLTRPIRPPASRTTCPAGPCVITFAGRITWEKGLDTLLGALTRIIFRVPVSLRIAGVVEDESYWAACQELIAVATNTHSGFDVSYLGHLDYAATDALLAASDIVAVPSRWPEPLGAIALEAMAAGCVVVASSIGGLVELIDDRSTGLLAAPGDVDDWAGILEAAIDQPPRRLKMAARARLAAIQRTIDAHVDELTALFDRSTAISTREPFS